METYITTCQKRKLKLIVNRKDDFKYQPEKFNPHSIANRILLESGINEGSSARVKYKNGKLKIEVKKVNSHDRQF